MDTVRRELTHAARRLFRSPTFTLATLALAIGANVAIFTLVNRVVLNPLQDSPAMVFDNFSFTGVARLAMPR